MRTTMMSLWATTLSCLWNMPICQLMSGVQGSNMFRTFWTKVDHNNLPTSSLSQDINKLKIKIQSYLGSRSLKITKSLILTLRAKGLDISPLKMPKWSFLCEFLKTLSFWNRTKVAGKCVLYIWDFVIGSDQLRKC